MGGGGTYLGPGGGGTYLGWRERVPTLDRGRGYLPWMGEGVPTLNRGGGTYLGQGEEVHNLGYPSPHPDLAGGRGTYLGQWEGGPTLEGGGGTYLGVITPPPRVEDRQTPVKTVPSRCTTYGGR